jgi:hypothetical protein
MRRRVRLATLLALAASLACGDGASGPSYVLTIADGDGQTDVVGRTLPVLYAVHVADMTGAAASGVVVIWTVTGGGGSVTASSTTDGTGLAQATRILGTVAGPATATAEAGGGSAVFTATALSGPATHMIKSAGDVQTGAPGLPLPVPFAVLVQDQYNNPVANVTVDWAVTAGGGQLSSASSASDGLGVARTTLTLGDSIGANTVTATSAGLGVPLTFAATSASGPLFVKELPIVQNYGLHDEFVRDGLAFLCAWNTGVLIYDVGNGIKSGSPANPQLVGQIVTTDSQHLGVDDHNAWWFHNPVTNQQKYLFVGQEGSGSVGSSSSGDIHVVDVSDLTHPVEVARFHRPGAGTHNFWMDEANQILYAAYYNGGVVAIDVSGTLSGDISSRMIDTLTFGAGDTYTWGVQLYNGSLYAMDMVSGFWQLTTASGALSVAAGGNNVPERYGSDLWVANGYAYTGTWGGFPRNGVAGNALKIWQLGAAGAPTLVDSIVTTGITTVSDVEVSDDNKLLMFSTENGPNSGFWFYRLTDPAHPSLAGSYIVTSPSGGIHTATFARISGHLYAFGAKDPSGAALIILDVTSLDR